MTGYGRPRILFIARAYPPTVGGMERFAFELSTNLAALTDVVPLINRHGKKALPIFLPGSLFAALREVRRRRVDSVHLADALLAPIGAAIKAMTHVPVTASVCGLDVTYPDRAYQAIIPRALRRLDLVMPISQATEMALRERAGNLPPSHVIPLGINPMPAPNSAARQAFEQAIAAPEGAGVVLTVGRLIERKGAAWFVANVLPLLDAGAIFAVVGEGPERSAIEQAASSAGVSSRLRILGRLPDDVLAAAYLRAQVFVMPNIPVAGDFEGFGLVALEASAAGLPVVASRIEGITEAIHHRGNGVLVPAGDARRFAAEIASLLAMPGHQRQSIGAGFARHTLSHFGWQETARRYATAIDALVRDHPIRVPAPAAESRHIA